MRFVNYASSNVVKRQPMAGQHQSNHDLSSSAANFEPPPFRCAQINVIQNSKQAIDSSFILKERDVPQDNV